MRFQKRKVRCILGLFLLLVSIPIAIGQTNDDGRLKASITIVSYLLEDSLPLGPVTISPGLPDRGKYGFLYGVGGNAEGIDFLFEAGGENLELCFVGVDIQGDELTLELNDHSLGSIEIGENCFTLVPGSAANQYSPGVNTLSLVHANPGDRWGVEQVSLQPIYETQLGQISGSDWDEKAVRKVLRVFAFGGHARDNQIAVWAGMDPSVAIEQMLNFSEHNLKLSPLPVGEKYNQAANSYGTFGEFSDFLSSNASNLPFPTDSPGSNLHRGKFDRNGSDRQGAFFRMATTRGLNPFRQFIGLWETNYHLATNLNAGVQQGQMVRFYDDIMQAHEAGGSYETVMGAAAKSAAVAMQYGHRRNRWLNGFCLCNEDFAREIHQLYFGILGNQDPMSNPLTGYNNHEEVTIPHTARMLTGMQLEFDDALGRYPDVISFGSSGHHTNSLNILNTQINGSNAAEKIDELVSVSIMHPESLQNLPVMIVSGLADGNLSDDNKNELRDYWTAMGSNKNFLEFVRTYAISKMFHSSSQFKAFSSIERLIYLANRFYINNTESLQDMSAFSKELADEDVEIFRPTRNVFGNQTGEDAFGSLKVFENNYNRFFEERDTGATVGIYYFRTTGLICSNCDSGLPWIKDWARAIPKTNGNYPIEEVAKWLWVHVTGSLDNYTALERASLLSILGAAEISSNINSNVHQSRYFDFPYLMCVRSEMLEENPSADVSLTSLIGEQGWLIHCQKDGAGNYTSSEEELLSKVYTPEEIESSPEILTLLDELGAQNIPLEIDPARVQRQYANERVHSALMMIMSTPYVFFEGELQ